jgi:LacI family transcriptional regulator
MRLLSRVGGIGRDLRTGGWWKGRRVRERVTETLAKRFAVKQVLCYTAARIAGAVDRHDAHRQRGPMANIYDVASEARVSVATVSAVVNESAYVSPALKRRVTAAIRKLGYHPNLLARSLARQQSHTIGMIVPNIANPFWPEVVRGVEDLAHTRGYALILASSDDDLEREGLYLDLFLSNRVDGILLTKAAGGLKRDVALRLRSAHAPVVQLMRSSPAIGGLKVLVDEQAGAYEGVTHLLRLGHSRIGMINGLGGVSTSHGRLVGYREALRDWGKTFVPSLVAEGDFRVESGYAAGVELLKRKPDALFIANYLMAVGVMRALRQYQLRCPEDIGIVTCDDHPWLDAFHPRLTTVNLPKYELGQAGARALLDQLDDPSQRRPRRRSSDPVVLNCSLCIRESCGYERRGVAGGIPVSRAAVGTGVIEDQPGGVGKGGEIQLETR